MNGTQTHPSDPESLLVRKLSQHAMSELEISMPHQHHKEALLASIPVSANDTTILSEPSLTPPSHCTSGHHGY